MKKEFKIVLKSEERLYLGDKNSKKAMKRRHHNRYFIWKYLYYFRLCQYYSEVRSNRDESALNRRLAKFLFRHYERKKNDYSYKSGVEIGLQSRVGKNCNIWHGGVVVNAVLGDNCTLHGHNLLGNKGEGKENQIPVVGSNVDIGVGAVLIGSISIADNSIIGAGAVVVKSFTEPGSVVAGVPGKLLRTIVRERGGNHNETCSDSV